MQRLYFIHQRLINASSMNLEIEEGLQPITSAVALERYNRRHQCGCGMAVILFVVIGVPTEMEL